MQPVLEIHRTDGFALWPVAEARPSGYLPLSGELTTAEVATAVMRIAECNDLDPEHDDRPPRPADPLGSFLHGLLTFEDLYAAGGMRVTDSSTGITLLPGCCNGLEEWRAWREVLRGSDYASFGHDPDPIAERVGDAVRLTVDAERTDSPVIELSVAELGRLLDGAERDLTGFLALAEKWVSENLPDRSAPVTAALVRALDL
ncbi:hypothetical protein [Streptomyces sp. NPDC001876]|uniref:hypothetical protein n=1 Tax=Streptomyces sp. NPDC001876 TaxID=3154402 RepID=UPI003322AFB4